MPSASAILEASKRMTFCMPTQTKNTASTTAKITVYLQTRMRFSLKDEISILNLL